MVNHLRGLGLIKSFGCKITEKYFHLGVISKGVGWQSVKKIVGRKLDMIDAASRLDDLRVPPNNRLEALKGDLSGKYSIRVNNQWRIIFEWRENEAYAVEVIDYH